MLTRSPASELLHSGILTVSESIYPAQRPVSNAGDAYRDKPYRSHLLGTVMSSQPSFTRGMWIALRSTLYCQNVVNSTIDFFSH